MLLMNDQGFHGPPRLSAGELRRAALLSLVFTVLAVWAYAPVRGNDFVNLDDYAYVTRNIHVQEGLTLPSLAWAFRSLSSANWHPLTWISHMADVHFFGLNPGAHHLVSLLLHCLNVILLFLILLRMTGALWRSALVAALFAFHPLNVESAAWIAERKNVLSTLFWLLTMWAYVSYVHRPSTKNYLQVLVVFALGLMAKPTLVTEPFVLLLMDFWPLGRWRRLPFTPGNPGADQALSPVTGREKSLSATGMNSLGLLREKIPLLVLSLASCLITIKAQSAEGSVASLHSLSLYLRLGNAATSYFIYLYRMVWPMHLAAIYPYPAVLPAGQFVCAVAGLSILTGAALRRLSAQPYIAVGWFWYLGTLVPVIGLIQVGQQANADRYVYIPLIGIFVALAWRLGDWTEKAPRARLWVVLVTVACLLGLIWRTRVQTRFWHDSKTLFQHALDVTDKNYVAQTNLGLSLEAEGNADGGLQNYFAALAIKPNYSLALAHAGNLKLQQGKAAEALPYLYAALRLPLTRNEEAGTRQSIGGALERLGDWKKAEEQYREVIKISPSTANGARMNLGGLLVRDGRYAEAAPLYQEILNAGPDASVYFLLGVAQQGAGDAAKAAASFREALRLEPNYIQAEQKLKAIPARAPSP